MKDIRNEEEVDENASEMTTHVLLLRAICKEP